MSSAWEVQTKAGKEKAQEIQDKFLPMLQAAGVCIKPLFLSQCTNR